MLVQLCTLGVMFDGSSYLFAIIMDNWSLMFRKKIVCFDGSFLILYCGRERSIFYSEISHLLYEISAFCRAVISASSCFERKVLGN